MTRWLPWVLWLAIVGSFAGVLVTGSANEDGEGSAFAYTFFIGAFATVGALVASRRPRNPIGWILLLAGLSYTVGGLTITQTEEAAPRRCSCAGCRRGCGWPGIGPVATFGLLLFPDGRLPSPRWRAFAWFAAAAIALRRSPGSRSRPGRSRTRRSRTRSASTPSPG